MLNFFSHLKDVIAFHQLSREDRRLTIYSEGKNYWSYLEGLLQFILDNSDVKVCYVTSSKSDPGLDVEHANLKKFVVGDGFVRDWFFANVETDVMVMTMPDLHQYQVKKSSHSVHYIYVQHSLVSFHMVYRPGAFDHYDTIFCAGPHHLEEMRSIEQTFNSPPKELFEHGYARLDSIIAEAEQRSPVQTRESKRTHFLLAPSWGPKGTIETGVGSDIVDLLLAHDAKVTLRPHPQTIILAKEKVDAIVSKHKDNPNFSYENNVQGQDSLHTSDVMICDWSGAALDYAFGLTKPVLFVDVERKVNNPKYTQVPVEPFEVSIREKIGKVIAPDRIEDLLRMDVTPLPTDLANKYVFNVGKSDEVGGLEIIRIVESKGANRRA